METYEKRVVAYADVLGWKAACYDLSKYSSLQSAALEIANYARNFSPQVKAALAAAQGVASSAVEQHADIEFSFFSDNFVVSGSPSQVELVFKILAFSSHALLRANFLVRGGVTIGNLYHKDNVLFGPALVEAVDLEKKANYPRLLCSQCLSEFLDRSSHQKDLLFQDSEEDWVVNIALGSAHALTDLSAILEKELGTLKTHADKWLYFRDMLPRMYQHKGIE